MISYCTVRARHLAKFCSRQNLKYRWGERVLYAAFTLSQSWAISAPHKLEQPQRCFNLHLHPTGPTGLFWQPRIVGEQQDLVLTPSIPSRLGCEGESGIEPATCLSTARGFPIQEEESSAGQVGVLSLLCSAGMAQRRCSEAKDVVFNIRFFLMFVCVITKIPYVDDNFHMICC